MRDQEHRGNKDLGLRVSSVKVIITTQQTEEARDQDLRLTE